MQTMTSATGTSVTNAANLAEMIISAVEQAPEQIITYVGSDSTQTMSYQATLDDAKKMLVNLQAAGLKGGDNVVLVLEKHSDNIPLLWACVLGGIVPWPITSKVSNTELWKNILKHISGILDNPTFIISQKNDQWVTIPNQILHVEDLRENDNNKPVINQNKLEGLAFLMFNTKGAPNLQISNNDVSGIPAVVTMSYGEFARPAYKLVVQEVNNLINNSKLTIIPEAYHIVPVQNPDSFIKAVANSFIEGNAD